LQHIKQGVFGICGHAVAFEQDIEEFVNTLPRGRKDVAMLNVLKVVKAEIGNSDDSNVTETFRVARDGTIAFARRGAPAVDEIVAAVRRG
jgi:hypothetical protein